MIVRDRAGGGIGAVAPAKLNLFLEVTGKRGDGYHDLESLMVAVDLCDTLTFDDEPSGALTLACDDPALPTGPENLVIKAAERLRAEAGTARGAAIGLCKSIPAQAGLGGGSSDAAATLAALNRLWGLGWPRHRLMELAGEVGSDVAFFLSGPGPAAVCRGRGERVEPLPLPGPLHFVIFCPPVGVSTAEVYARLTPPDRPRPIGPFLEAIAGAPPAEVGRMLFNRLGPIAEQVRPALGRVREALANLVPSHLDGHLMSGSGSAHFGLCRDRDAAREAARRLEATGLGRAHVAASVADRDDAP